MEKCSVMAWHDTVAHLLLGRDRGIWKPTLAGKEVGIFPPYVQEA